MMRKTDALGSPAVQDLIKHVAKFEHSQGLSKADAKAVAEKKVEKALRNEQALSALLKTIAWRPGPETMELLKTLRQERVKSRGADRSMPPGVWSVREIAAGGAGSLQALSLKEVFDKDHKAGMAMLKEYYNGLSSKRGYPGEGEVEPPTVLEKYFKRTDIDWDIVVFKSGKQIIGGMNINAFDGTNKREFGAIEQGWMDDKKCNEAQAKAAFEEACARLRERGAKYILAEMNDLHLMDQAKKKEDFGRTLFRADNGAFMHKAAGFHIVDAKYMQPQLNLEDKPVEHLMLGVRRADPNDTAPIPAALYLQMIKNYFASFDIIQKKATTEISAFELVERNPTYKEIVASVQAVHLGDVARNILRRFGVAVDRPQNGGPLALLSPDLPRSCVGNAGARRTDPMLALRINGLMVMLAEGGKICVCGNVSGVKSQLLEAVSRTVGSKIETLDAKKSPDITDCFGRYVKKGEKVAYVPGPLRIAVETGRTIVIDNAEKFGAHQIEILRHLTPGRAFRDPNTGNEMTCQKGFRVVLLCNGRPPTPINWTTAHFE